MYLFLHVCMFLISSWTSGPNLINLCLNTRYSDFKHLDGRHKYFIKNIFVCLMVQHRTKWDIRLDAKCIITAQGFSSSLNVCVLLLHVPLGDKSTLLLIFRATRV